MHFLHKLIFISLTVLFANNSIAQDSANDAEQLKIAALEALMSAPPDRALPLVAKVLASDSSDEIKSRALFVLSQIDLPEAQAILLETARNDNGELRLEAIRMIGISGDPTATAGLADIYRSGDNDTKEAVLQAYHIADDTESVYEIAANATSDEEFDQAVHILAVMGANDELRQLRDRPGSSESLIDAYAISGDIESLRELAMDNSNPERQSQAIHGLGIVGGDEVNTTLVEIYRGTESPDVRDAALHGMMIADHDEGVLELFKASQNAEEKTELLRMLVMMDSDAAMDAIEKALDGGP
jgi:HEAT repeat protein